MGSRRRPWLPLLICLALFACSVIPAGCGKADPPQAGPPRPGGDPGPPDDKASGPGFFTDVTAASGLDFTHRNGEQADHYTILESLGGGVALIDHDGDGLLDVFVTGGGYFDGPEKKQIKGYPNRLYKNLSGWRFRDVTKEVGLDQPLFYNHGCAVADFDNDGWPDLLVTGYGRLALYRNRAGKAFEEVTRAAGLLDPKGRPDLHWSTSAAWADLDGDGHVDLFVCHYVDWSFEKHIVCKGGGPQKLDVCPPTPYKSLSQQLYLNNGDGTFRDGSRLAALRPGKALGVVVVDVDGDGKPDVYVASDGVDNHLYLNKGGGRFEEAGMRRGVALSELGLASGSMGVDAADYDGSGHFSLFVTNFQQQPHDLYRNRGGGWFDHATRQAGILAIGLDFVGFGTGFIDYDRDGAEDLFISNGHVLRYPFPPATLAQRAVLFRNLRRPGERPTAVRFQEVSDQAGPYFRGKHRGRGVAFGDLDNDGRPDLVISHCNEPVTLLRNADASNNHWLGVQLIGKPNRDAIGAVLTLEVEGRKLVRASKGGGSYLSSNDPRVLFGLGRSAKADRLTVRWPSGRTQTWDGGSLGVDRYLLLREGEERVHSAGGGKQ
ncbi:MAG: CRTAC1 family protein [Gemmataceae bacterium]|nr:CRTAC1 family protein [Gemmataceae bacterium]